MPWSGRKSYSYGGYALLIDREGARVYRGLPDNRELELESCNIPLAAAHYTDLLAHKIMEECREIAAAMEQDPYTGESL